MNQETATWNRTNLKDPHKLPDKRRLVRVMFSAIAHRYDLLNHILSLNMDRSWRRRAVELAQPKPDQAVLDLCCGTGDLALQFARTEPRLSKIVGVDFSEEMLEIARNKQRKKQPLKQLSNQPFKQSENQPKNQTCRYNHPIIKWLCEDAENVPLPGEQFDCVTCAFGIRNLQNLQTALREMFRLLKPRGRLVILEFAMPRNHLLSALYECYFKLVLPCLGSIISNDKYGAYRYLPHSVISFPNAHKLKQLIKQANFSTVRIEYLCRGVVLAIVAEKNIYTDSQIYHQ